MSDNTSQALIELLIRQRVLKFGEFTLKSGRKSPYFFNLGELCTGAAMTQLAQAYVEKIQQSGFTPQVLFGPAYKGIPLAVAVATALAERGQDIGFAFNRKERKDHGEGGEMVGAPLAGRRVLLLDDVLTAGTALREAIAMVRQAGGLIEGVIITMDRQERGTGEHSAVSTLAEELQAPVLSLISLSDLVQYLDASTPESDGMLDNSLPDQRELKQRMMNYQTQYCVASL